VVAEMADRVIIMRHGRMVEEGKTSDIFARPQADYTRELLAAVPRIGSGVGREKSRDAVEISKPANVADLQQRVERMANMHAAMGNMQMGPQSMIAGTVKYEALPTGARLTMKPNDASKLKEFREQVRSRVEQMKKGDCSMMQGMMMQGMMMQGKSGGAEKK